MISFKIEYSISFDNDSNDNITLIRITGKKNAIKKIRARAAFGFFLSRRRDE